MHHRQAIVAAAVEILRRLPSTGERVHPGRAWPVKPEAGAYLLVYARREASQPQVMGRPHKLDRQLILTVEGFEAGGTDDDAALDTIAAEVEAALAADPTLGGAVKDLWLAATNIDVNAEEGEVRLGRVRLEFNCTYRTLATVPASAIS